MIQIETYKDGSKTEGSALTFSDGFMIRFFGCWYRYETLEDCFDAIRAHYKKFGCDQ